jgi:uncharacterized protein (UPF0264 family)
MITKWLASVESLEEAKSLVEQLPHILDMKNPSEGALGALNHQTVTEIVNWINKGCLCSATVGDLPMQAEITSAAIRNIDEPGLIQCIQQLEPTIKSLSTPVIAVIFADQLPQQKLIPLLAKTGFAGVMLDTARKDGQGLLNHLSVEVLQQFVVEAKSAGMLCGLAGALRIEDIETLSPLQPDYLGFRSALCQQHHRTNRLDPELAKQIQNKLNAALPEVLAC